MKRIFFLICFVFCVASIYAQKQWTLEDCLRYAQDNNITIKKAFLNTEISKQNHLQSKIALFP
ncbi:TolC family protein, partial [Flavobacteriales bacterium]|nr:TolC family protein [Flavobacteriales bacterium]